MQQCWFKHIAWTAFLLFLFSGQSSAQVSLEGPVCIVVGLPYQYNVNNKGVDTSFRFCISGGTIADVDTTCSDIENFSFIRVVWTDSTGGSISLVSSTGTTSLAVSIAKKLEPGEIDSAFKIQNVLPGSIPFTIPCSEATGGSCSAVYVYQWEQSADGIRWQPIPDAESAQLTFNAPVTEVTYYRRKVTDQNGNSEDFSDIAIVSLQPSQQ